MRADVVSSSAGGSGMVAVSSGYSGTGGSGSFFDERRSIIGW